MTSNLSWKEIGPTEVGGRTRAVMWDPNDPNNNKIWVGSVSGGLWYSADFTYRSQPNWYKVNDFWDNIAISSLDYDPTNTQIFYASTGEGWFNLDAVRGGGVWKSTNGGRSWDHLSSTANFEFIQKLKVHPQNGDVYIATRGGGLRRSTDKGSTWDIVLNTATSGNSTLSNRAADIEFGADNTIYVTFGVFSTGEVWKSSTGDEGDWEKINTGSNGFPNNNIQRIELATAPSDAGTLYAMVQGGGRKVTGLYKTTNKGNNWSSITLPKNAKGDTIAGKQAWYDLILQVHPNSTDTLYAGGVNLYRSNDGGNSWSRVGKGVVHADQHAVQWRPNYPNHTVIGNDGGIYYTTDQGNSFQNKNSNYNVTQFYTLAIDQNDPGYFLGGTQDNGTRRITNKNLPPVPSGRPVGGDGGECFINQSNNNIQIASYIDVNHYVSTNGGQSFSRVIRDTIGGRFINPIAYDESTDRLYVTRTDDTMLRMDDVSKSSRSIDTLTNLGFSNKPSVIKVSPYSSNTLFIGIANNSGVELYKMTNAHTNSPNLTEISNGGLFNGYISDIELGGSESEIAVTKSNYGVVSIFYTSDGGSNWEWKEGNLPDIPVRDFMFHRTDRTIVYIATEIGVWSTNNFDKDDPVWVPSNNGLANVRTDAIAYRDIDQHIVAATHGRGIFEAYLPMTDKANVNLISSRYTPSEAMGVAKIGSHIFIADKWEGIHVFDVSDVGNPQQIGRLGFLTDTKDITSQNNYLFEISDSRLAVFDASDPENIGVTGFLDFYSGNLKKVTVKGNYAYLSAGRSGMHIVDISDPFSPAKVTTINTQGKTKDVAVKGTRIFLADSQNGFLEVDVSDPNNPVILKRYNTTGTVVSLDVQGEFLYVNDFLDGFKIFYIGNIGRPIKLSTVNFTNVVYNTVRVSGQYAYLGGYSTRIIDVSDPRNPIDAGHYDGPYRANDLITDGKYIYTSLTKGLHIYRNDLIPTGTNWNTTFIANASQPSTARDVEVAGNYVLVADRSRGILRILDITDDQNITETSSLNVGYELVKVKQRDKYAYCIDQNEGLYIVDISDVTNPTITSSSQLGSRYDDKRDITFYENYALVGAESDGIYVIDISDPANPVNAGKLHQNLDVFSVNVYGKTLHVGGGNDGYYIYDLQNTPNSFTLIGSYEGGDKFQDIKVMGDYAYAAADHDYFLIFDISDQSNPVKVGYYQLNDAAEKLEVDSHFAYIANDDEGLTILNISNPNNPTLAGFYKTSTSMLNLDLTNRKVFAANGEGGVNIIENNLNPYGDYKKFTKEICVETDGGAMNVDVYGNYAYAADGLSGIAVVDVSNTSSSQKVANLPLPGFTKDVVINGIGTYLYTANYRSGMRVIDISNRTSPQEVGSYQNGGFIAGIDEYDNIVALADQWKGAVFVDVSDPQNPAFLSEWNTGSKIIDVELYGNYAFISDGDITILDISSQSNPSVVTSISTPGKSGKISYAQDYLYVADGIEGVSLIDLQNPQTPKLLTTNKVGGYITDIYSAGRFAYVSSDEFGLKAIDFIVKSKPSEVAYTNSEGTANGVHVFGSTVYLANGNKGLCLFENEYRIPSEYDINPNNVVFEIEPPQISLHNPVKIFNNTQTPIEFNFNISFGPTDPSGDISGEWLLTTDWGECDEIEINETVINFFTDNTFVTSSGNTGNWTLNDDKIIIFFDNGTTYYGVVENDYMYGDVESPDGIIVACWNANQISGYKANSISLNKTNFDEANKTQKSGVVEYTLTPADNWLIIEPSGGVIDANSGVEIDFSVDVSELSFGLYAAEVEFNNQYENYSMKVELYYDDETSVTTSQKFNPGWSLISLPLEINNTSVDSLFPRLPADIYGFDERYEKPNSLAFGKGYWIKLNTPQTITVSGDEIVNNIPVKEGWNIIGPFNQSVDVSELSTEPEGILISNFFGFDESYSMPQTLNPWSGYWIQASEDGSIILPRNKAKQKSNYQPYVANNNWIEIIITDKNGRSQSLYLSDKEINSRLYQLPPFPPGDVFDVRYGDGTYATNVTSGGKRVVINSAEFPYTVQVNGGDIRVKDNMNGDALNKILRDGDKITIDKENLISLNVSAVEIPVDFTLMQNYPNPFNPTTTIKFGLPEEAKVDLVIYDILGQRIENIVSEKFEAGYHEVVFNGGRLASGVYLYRISADNFSKVKKMILIK